MNFLIASSFTGSLARLTGQEQKAVKTTAFDLQLNPASPGHSFHKLDRAKDRNFWSVRVNRDIRIIVHRTPQSLLLAYVGHHDDAYGWAERRRIETHPRTGAAQIVVLHERAGEAPPDFAEPATAAPPAASAPPPPRPPLFAGLDDAALLSAGVPESWLAPVRAADEDGFLALADHLPGEAAEALLTYAATGALPASAPVAAGDPFTHPDAQRRFRVMDNVEELKRALDYPWERWTIFLHPAQRAFVERVYNGPARISGSAGTGKTVVALHRAVHLARSRPGARVLLTTFNKGLANALSLKLRRLAGEDEDLLSRITVRPIRQAGHALYAEWSGQPNMAGAAQIRALLKRERDAQGLDEVSEAFLYAEWSEVVDAWNLRSWAAYRDVPRLGRKTRLGLRQRERLWTLFEAVRGALDARGLLTWPGLFARLAAALDDGAASPFDFAVIDEAQDIGVSELRFLAALRRDEPQGLFFAGDLGQRIFQQPFSWLALGVDIRGRSATLKVNYRTSHQIRKRADRLLPSTIRDVDGMEDDRRGAVSVFNGPEPAVALFDSEDDEINAVTAWLKARAEAGVDPAETGVFVRSQAQMARARKAVKASGLPFAEPDDGAAPPPGALTLATMHRAKGLEFKAVAVMACDDEVIPLQERVEQIIDEGDLQEVYDTERHLLYVACTRARDALLVTGVMPASEFLDDLMA